MSTKLFLAVIALLMLSVNAQQKYAWHNYNEGPSGNRCSNSIQCDGLRTCTQYGWCTGNSRPGKDSNYYYN